MSAKPHTDKRSSEVVSMMETPSSADSLEQIRTILFGKQIQEYEDRLTHLEDKLIRENNKLKDILEKQLHNLEKALQERMEAAMSRIEEERDARQAGQQALTEVLQTKSGELLNELRIVQEGADQELSDVKNHLLEQKKEIYRQLDQQEGNLAGIFQEMSNKLANRQV